MQLYYYILDGKQAGPLALDELVKIIDTNTLVWCSDSKSNEWKAAKDIPEIINFIKKTAPPPLPNSATPPIINQASTPPPFRNTAQQTPPPFNKSRTLSQAEETEKIKRLAGQRKVQQELINNASGGFGWLKYAAIAVAVIGGFAILMNSNTNNTPTETDNNNSSTSAPINEQEPDETTASVNNNTNSEATSDEEIAKQSDEMAKDYGKRHEGDYKENDVDDFQDAMAKLLVKAFVGPEQNYLLNTNISEDDINLSREVKCSREQCPNKFEYRHGYDPKVRYSSFGGPYCSERCAHKDHNDPDWEDE